MSEPKFDQKGMDQTGMFDFLSNDTEGQSARRSAVKKKKNKSMPVIRKPVPVSESGPLLAPKPGDPVATPPPLTDIVVKESEDSTSIGKKQKVDDNLDFLDETVADGPDLGPVIKDRTQTKAPDNVRPIHKSEIDDESQEMEDEFDHLNLTQQVNRHPDFTGGWHAERIAEQNNLEKSSAGPAKWAMVAGVFVVLGGGGYYGYSAGYFDKSSLSQVTDAATSTVDDTSAAITDSIAAEELESGLGQKSTLASQFREQLATLETLMQSGSLDEAELLIGNMDRSVYGYGAAEFSTITDQIALARSGQQQVTANTELSETQRLEELRIQEEAVLLAEIQRLEELRVQEEAVLLAQTQRLEEQRVQEQAVLLAETQRLEEQRVQEEAVLLAETQRLEEQRVQDEAVLLAEIQRLEALQAQEEAALLATNLRQEARMAEIASAAENARLADIKAQEQKAAEAQRLAQLKIKEEAELLAKARESALLEQAKETARLEQIEEATRLEQAKEAERIELAAEEAARKALAEEVARLEQEKELALLEQAKEIARLKQAEEAATIAEVKSLKEQEREAEQLLESQKQAQLSKSDASSSKSSEVSAEDKIRLDALEDAVREDARQTAIAADKLATDRRIAEEQRTARFERAKEIEAENAAASNLASVAPLENEQRSSDVTSQESSISSANSEARNISDEELETAYERFAQLQNAISNRDISQVVSLTERSGLKVQQFMQVFENSVGIDVRIRNVSTSIASGEINGTLQIRSIERNDGTIAEPPANLKTIKVTTQRQGDNWSVIRW